MYLYMCSFLETKSVALCERATSAVKKRDASRIGTPERIVIFTWLLKCKLCIFQLFGWI